jgi:hypothetical protein
MVCGARPVAGPSGSRLLQFALRLACPHQFEPAFSLLQPTVLTQEPIAIFGTLAQPGLLGTEVGMDAILAQVLSKIAPQMKVIPPITMLLLVNRKGLTDEYTLSVMLPPACSHSRLWNGCATATTHLEEGDLHESLAGGGKL